MIQVIFCYIVDTIHYLGILLDLAWILISSLVNSLEGRQQSSPVQCRMECLRKLNLKIYKIDENLKINIC